MKADHQTGNSGQKWYLPANRTYAHQNAPLPSRNGEEEGREPPKRAAAYLYGNYAACTNGCMPGSAILPLVTPAMSPPTAAYQAATAVTMPIHPPI